MSGRASIGKMRRWGVRWHTIAKCVLGFHLEWRGRGICSRCGANLGLLPTKPVIQRLEARVARIEAKLGIELEKEEVDHDRNP